MTGSAGTAGAEVRLPDIPADCIQRGTAIAVPQKKQIPDLPIQPPGGVDSEATALPHYKHN